MRSNATVVVAIETAFKLASRGFSVDRVIADPALNSDFVEACKQGGMTDPPVTLNLSLLNLRKRAGLPAGARRTIVGSQDDYSFAAEIAARCLERKHQTTLDRILCDPTLAAEFDHVAGLIAPGFSSLEYRWAALRLRKSSRLKPELLGRVVATHVVGPVAVAYLKVDQIESGQGIYLITACDKVLYVGEAASLRARIRKHLDHSDNKALARYLWEFGQQDVWIEYHLLPPGTATRVRKAMELELIRSRRAEFNVQR